MKNKEIAEILSQWFKKPTVRDKCTRDPVWKLLKQELTKLGHWKDLPRGNPRKGYKSQQANQGHEADDY